jgi:hypothetical protein
MLSLYLPSGTDGTMSLLDVTDWGEHPLYHRLETKCRHLVVCHLVVGTRRLGPFVAGVMLAI